MISLRVIISTLLFFFSLQAFSVVKIRDIVYEGVKGNLGSIHLKLEGLVYDSPELKVRDNLVLLSIPNSLIKNKLKKQLSLRERSDTIADIYQFSHNTVNINISFPFSLKGFENKVFVKVGNDGIHLKFPLVALKTIPKIKKASKKILVKNKTNKYNENYLDKLLKDYESNNTGNDDLFKDKSLNTNIATDKIKDSVSIKQSSEIKEKKEFSLMPYIGKFVVVLCFIIFLIYCLVALLKRGVFNKSKLNFLKKTTVLEVLQTQFIAPKKSLMLVRVHNQVFLLGNSDNGVNFLSEIDDSAGLLKRGERDISGSNFDMAINSNKNNNEEFKLKKSVQEEKEYNEEDFNLKKMLNTDVEDVEDRPHVEPKKKKVSDKIKDKIKNLRSLQ